MPRCLETCFVCGRTEFKPLYYPRRSPGEVVRCLHCGMVFVQRVEDGNSIIDDDSARHVESNLPTSKDLNDLVGCWEVTELAGKLAEAPILRANALDALDRIAHYCSPPGRLLDFGCGWGFFLQAAKECGWSPFGLEPLPGHALFTRVQVEADVRTDILRADTYPLDYFDTITSFQVFEHLPDPAGDMTRLHKTLKPGGLLLIEVPNIDTWSVRLLGKQHRHFVPDHLNFFSVDTLCLLFEKNGFEIVGTYHPSRRMSVRHLITAWGGHAMPKAVVNRLEERLHHSPLWEKTIRLNLGDIIAVMGRKEV